MRIKICFPYAKSPAARYSPCRGAFVFRYETAALLQKLQRPGDTRYDAVKVIAFFFLALNIFFKHRPFIRI